MLKSFFNNVKAITVTASIAAGFAYGFCYYRANKNQKQYLGAIKSDTLKDASRLTNDSFGISWGFQADDTVMNSIDSGDLFFLKYECIECLDPVEMLKCYRLTLPLLDEQYHAVAVAYRDQSGLMSYFNQFGQNKLMRYSQFVSLPYIKQLMVQKTSSNVHAKLVKLLEQDKAFDQSQETPANSAQDSVKSDVRVKLATEKFKNLIIPKQETFKFINRVLSKISVLDEGQQIVDIRQLLRNEKQINIRTETNKILRSL